MEEGIVQFQVVHWIQYAIWCHGRVGLRDIKDTLKKEEQGQGQVRLGTYRMTTGR